MFAESAKGDAVHCGIIATWGHKLSESGERSSRDDGRDNDILPTGGMWEGTPCPGWVSGTQQGQSLLWIQSPPGGEVNMYVE